MKEVIISEIERYRKNLGNSNEGFIQKWPSAYSIHGWLISLAWWKIKGTYARKWLVEDFGDNELQKTER